MCEYLPVSWVFFSIPILYGERLCFTVLAYLIASVIRWCLQELFFVIINGNVIANYIC